VNSVENCDSFVNMQLSQTYRSYQVYVDRKVSDYEKKLGSGFFRMFLFSLIPDV
jgi:hypothetical protein